MGSGGTEWEVADVVSASRMNQKTNFVGTGSQINALSTTYPGMSAFCTTSGSGFKKNVSYRRDQDDNTWLEEDKKPYTVLSDNGGDYKLPDSATISSGSQTNPTLSVLYNHQGAVGLNPMSTTNLRYGQQIDAGFSGIGSVVYSCSVWLSRTGSPTGNCYLKVYRSGDNVNAIATSAAVDVSTIPTSATQYDFYLSALVTLATNDRIVVEYTGSDATNYLNVRYGAVNPIANTQQIRWSGSAWANDTTRDVDMKFNIVASSTVPSAFASSSEANPNIKYDFGNASDFVGFSLVVNTTNTTVTALIIRASTDSTFTDSENVAYINKSDFTNNVTRFIAINELPENKRHVQIYGVGTGVLDIGEFRARYGLTATEKSVHLHKTRDIGSADSFVDDN